VDLLLKRDRLQSAGVPSYWLVDPDALTVTILELREGTYDEVAMIAGDDVCDVGLSSSSVEQQHSLLPE